MHIKIYLEAQGDRDGYNDSKKLDWKCHLYWKTSQYPDDKYAEVMESLYLPPAKRINNERLLDTQKLKYSYEWEDIATTAVKDNNRSAKYLKKTKHCRLSRYYSLG